MTFLLMTNYLKYLIIPDDDSSSTISYSRCYDSRMKDVAIYAMQHIFVRRLTMLKTL